MKKLTSIIGILSVLTVPAFAEEAKSTTGKTSESAELQPETIPETEKLTSQQAKEYEPALHGLQLGIGISAASGLNGFVGYVNKDSDSFWWKRLGVRLDFASTSVIDSVVSSGIDSIMGEQGLEIGDGITLKDGSAQGHHAAALLDFYPFGNTWFFGGIRISGGYYFGNLDVNANLTGKVSDLPDSEMAFELNGESYRYLGNQVHGTATADWDYRGPYLGAGFDLGLFAGFKIYMDAGVVFTNKTAQLNLDLPTDNLQKWNGSSWESVDAGGFDEFEAAKQAALADAQSELDKLKFYPVVKLGFMYRF